MHRGQGSHELWGPITSASASGNHSITYGQGLGNNNRERITPSLPCFLVVLLESYTGLWTFLSRPSVGIFLGLPDEILFLSWFCVAVWSRAEETSGWFHGGILQLFDAGTINWLRAISFHPTHTNRSFHFITLHNIICTTVVSGSCSCHTLTKPNAVPVLCTITKTPNLLSYKVVSIFSFLSLWPLTLTVLKDKELYLCSVVLAPKLLQLWGKMSFQKGVSELWSTALVSLSVSGECDHATDPCSQPWGFPGFLSLPLWFYFAPGFSAACYFTDFFVQTAGLGDKSPRDSAQWSWQLLFFITFISFLAGLATQKCHCHS